MKWYEFWPIYLMLLIVLWALLAIIDPKHFEF